MAEQYIYPCWLVSVAAGEQSDDLGNPVVSRTKRKVLVALLDTAVSEFYQAKALGYKTLTTIKIKTYDYKGETEFIFDGENLSLLRASGPANGSVKLVLYRGVNEHGNAAQSD